MSALIAVIISLAAVVGGALAWVFKLGDFITNVIDKHNKAQQAKNDKERLEREKHEAVERTEREKRQEMMDDLYRMMNAFKDEAKDLRERSLSTEERLNGEIRTLNKRVRLLERERDGMVERMADLEWQNSTWKAQLYDAGITPKTLPLKSGRMKRND